MIDKIAAMQMLRLNLGCGRNILDGWTNVDHVALPGVDVMADLDACAKTFLPFMTDSVDELLLSHVLEHVNDTLGLMQELHRIAKPNARLTIRVPHGASDDAWEDPTHKRAYFSQSFGYFSQPYYWRADYGYRGDWAMDDLELFVPRDEFVKQPPDVLLHRINRERNLVVEMCATLHAVKPVRPASRELLAAPPIRLVPE
jgi:SAM-dependent methyltransferase